MNNRIFLFAWVVLTGWLTAVAQSDYTSRITNPSFEQEATGWAYKGMSAQGNNVFDIKDGNIYMEKWTGRGGAVGDGRVAQRLKGMMPDRYRLKAAAQNIQEDTPKAAQTGAWLFAGTNTEPVTVRDTYTLEFVQVADVMEIGFEAKGATGNWLAVDNFQLEYIGDSFEDIKAAFADLIAKGEALTTQKTNATAHQALEEALAAAKTAYDNALVDDGFPVIATALESAIATAATSQEVFARLAAAIAAANEELTTSTATQKADYQAAINTAQDIYDAATTTDANAEAAISVSF